VAEITVGVVVAAFNAERWIAASLRSLQNQSYTRWQCIVVDDGSTDRTADLVQEFVHEDSRYRLIRQSNAGSSVARNTGIAALPAICHYVSFLDSDDLYAPDALAALVDALTNRPDAVGAYGLADFIDENGDPALPGMHSTRQRDRRSVRGRRLYHVPPAADATFSTLVVGGPIWPPAVAIQRMSDVKAVGGFDPSFPNQEDWDLYVRLSRRGPFVSLDRHLAWYRRHSGNLTGDHMVSAYQQERVRRKAFKAPENSSLQARQVANAWRYLEARQAAVLAKQSVRALAGGQVGLARRYFVGVLMCATQLPRFGPPKPNHTRVRYTRPATLPGAQLFPS
jgi:glycosyltransferase involved in cell wall biosynthesis